MITASTMTALPVAKPPVVIPKPREFTMYRDLGLFRVDPRKPPSERFKFFDKDGHIDPSVTPKIKERLFPKNRPQREKTLEIGLLACPRRDYASTIRKHSEGMLAKDGYRFAGLGGFLGFFLACPHVTCSGLVSALGYDMSRSRDIMLGIKHCSHENPFARKIVAEKLSTLGKGVPAVYMTPIFIIIVKDIV
jgi:hypothetical protein